MANPINPTGATQLPPPNEPFIDPLSGLPTQNFYRWCLATFTRTGGTSGTDANTIQVVAENALTVATSAANEASTAEIAATHAQSTATAALAIGNTASNQSSTALSSIKSINNTALFRMDNLASLADVAESRTNLGVDIAPLIFQIDSLSSSVTKVYPVIRNLTFRTNFLGSIAYAVNVPAININLTLAYIRSGVSHALGSISFFAGGHIGYFSAQPEQAVITGDILTLTCPSDVSMGFVGVNLLTVIS